MINGKSICHVFTVIVETALYFIMPINSFLRIYRAYYNLRWPVINQLIDIYN